MNNRNKLILKMIHKTPDECADVAIQYAIDELNALLKCDNDSVFGHINGKILELQSLLKQPQS